MPATEKYWRDLNKMHVIFACSAVALLGVTLWMMAEDHSEEWHDYQRSFTKVNVALGEQQKRDIKTSEFETKTTELEESINSEKESLGNDQDYLKFKKEAAKAKLVSDVLARDIKSERAHRDVARANYDLAIANNKPKSVQDEKKALFDKQQAVVEKMELDLQLKDKILAEANAKVSGKSKKLDDLKAALGKLQTDLNLIHKAVDEMAPEGTLKSVKRAIMEWPIIDGFNSHQKVDQIWLPNLKITLGMSKTARFDRCRTCHLGIDKVQAGGVPTYPFGETDSKDPKDWVKENKYPQPYATHPNTDLYLTSASPHPSGKFGCTICHEGQGSGVNFTNAAHYFNDPAQHHEWEHKYGFKTNHYWEYPMYAKRFTEATCIKCHHKMEELGNSLAHGNSAPKVYNGYKIIEKYGCFGCHEIHGYENGESIGPDLRLEPGTPEEIAKIAADPGLIAGQMRKVGPALRHIASKTTEAWTEIWTKEPKNFRPTTKMPQFFHLTNQEDELAKELMPVEIASLTTYLFDKSEPIDLLKPAKSYKPNAKRGQELFTQRGCMACHSHGKVEGGKADFGPDLSKISQKIKPLKSGQKLTQSEGFRWLYTWVREPERHHKRTKMPNLFLEAFDLKGETIDPAADIAAFLMEGSKGDYKKIKVENEALDKLVVLFLRGSKLLRDEEIEGLLTSKNHAFPVPKERIKGDEVELLSDSKSMSEAEWHRMKLNYVGRRTISRYGCYGCHDIPGFETARPVGTTLQDWGRKETSKLAFEHIAEFLHHHGEPDGSSTAERVHAIEKEAGSGLPPGENGEKDLSAAYFYESILHHGREGFVWQKLRAPRSYDYEKIETKRYDERLRMPKFPLTEEEAEEVATFILGLVAEPPASEYIYQPDKRSQAIIDGERLLRKYNCTGCHMTELPEIRFAADLEDLVGSELGSDQYEAGKKLLLKLHSAHNGLTGESRNVIVDEEKMTLPVVSFYGIVGAKPDPEDDPEDWEFTFNLWQPLQVGENLLLPSEKITVPYSQIIRPDENSEGYYKPAKGGSFAEFLVQNLMETKTNGNPDLAWQMAPPILNKEGIKVQTPWLYKFLLNPGKIRHTTVLRMPQFNMSDMEAQSLANYFAAIDNTEFPYQDIPQKEPEYLSSRKQQLVASGNLKRDEEYLDICWKALNMPLCVTCHSVGGKVVKGTGDPSKQIRGPNLVNVNRRLKPDWVMLWLYNPRWVTPYTGMPLPIARDKKEFPDLFNGERESQVIGVRDALMNYTHLMETIGITDYKPPKEKSAKKEDQKNPEEIDSK